MREKRKIEVAKAKSKAMKGKVKNASTSIALIRESMAAVLRLVEEEEEDFPADM